MRHRYIRTEDRVLVRDLHSKALVNTDKSALERNRAIRAKLTENILLKREIDMLGSVCRNLESRLDKLTEILEHSLITR